MAHSIEKEKVGPGESVRRWKGMSECVTVYVFVCVCVCVCVAYIISIGGGDEHGYGL